MEVLYTGAMKKGCIRLELSKMGSSRYLKTAFSFMTKMGLLFQEMFAIVGQVFPFCKPSSLKSITQFVTPSRFVCVCVCVCHIHKKYAVALISFLEIKFLSID
jgi:hypothetical protein